MQGKPVPLFELVTACAIVILKQALKLEQEQEGVSPMIKQSHLLSAASSYWGTGGHVWREHPQGCLTYSSSHRFKEQPWWGAAPR